MPGDEIPADETEADASVLSSVVFAVSERGGLLGFSKPQNRTKLGGKTEKPLKKSTKTENRSLTLIFDDPPVILLILKGSENNS